MIIDVLERNREEMQEIKDCFINTLSWIMKKRDFLGYTLVEWKPVYPVRVYSFQTQNSQNRYILLYSLRSIITCLNKIHFSIKCISVSYYYITARFK